MSSNNGTRGAAAHPPPNVGDVVTCISTKKAYQVTEIVNAEPRRVKLISVKRNSSREFDRDMVAIGLIWEYYIPTWR